MIYGLSEDFKEANQVGSEMVRIRRVDFGTGEVLGEKGFMLGVPRRPGKGRSEAPMRLGLVDGSEGTLPLQEGDV